MGHALHWQWNIPQLPQFPIQFLLFWWAQGLWYHWEHEGLYTHCEAKSSWITIFSCQLLCPLKRCECYGSYYETQSTNAVMERLFKSFRYWISCTELFKKISNRVLETSWQLTEWTLLKTSLNTNPDLRHFLFNYE